MAIRIEHTHEEGTLVHGTDRGDGSAPVLKACRFRWSRNLGCWYRPNSRDRDFVPGVAESLEAAGFTVELSVCNERRAVADVQSDRLERSAERAERLSDRAAGLDAAAAASAAHTRELMDVIPFGQPILVGHHSEKRHRAHVGRIDRSVQRTAETFRDAEATANAAASARATVARAKDPAYIQNRIDDAERDLRAAQRGHRLIEGGTTGPLAERVAEAEERLAYWRGELERVEESGRKVYKRGDIATGDFVKIRHGWGKVERANPKTVSVMVGMPWPLKYKYAEISGHRTAAEAAAVVAAAEQNTNEEG